MPTSTISTPLLPGNLSTLDSSDSRAMSPLSFFESVLSEVNQSSAGLQPDDWLLSGDAEVLEEALGLMHSGTKYSMLLGSGGESQKWEGSREKISAGPYKGQMHVGAAFSSKRSIRDSRLEAVQEPADIPPGLPSTSTDPEHAGAAGVLESPVLRSLLSSSSTGNIQPGMPSTSIDPEQGGAGGDVESSALVGVLSSSSTGSIQPSSPKGSEDSLQVLASQAQAAADNLVASRGWLEAMLRGVSEQLLRTHPFYRLPEVEPSPGGRSFSILNAGAFRYRKQRVAWVLDIFRQLLTKDRLTSKELEVLLEKTEQLYGYATTRMPVYNNTKSGAGHKS
ncbi:hypothetical protein EMWEY_00057330 [Eimeria maxima]|uniref:Uncharacterized protein n=1 Tax=Eimeria maxima TaxID=5804 RepID=U6M0S3_EIMMA|nr:hypothetical protein EMWEY_00057330 [Eimeria maxima]CDJ56688.1 hypothetical protein EMWEY_00057330 [Eimeria maxima]